MIVRVADTPFSCHLQTELTHEMISGTNLTFRFGQVAFSNCEAWFDWSNIFVGRMKIFV